MVKQCTCKVVKKGNKYAVKWPKHKSHENRNINFMSIYELSNVGHKNVFSYRCLRLLSNLWF